MPFIIIHYSTIIPSNKGRRGRGGKEGNQGFGFMGTLLILSNMGRGLIDRINPVALLVVGGGGFRCGFRPDRRLRWRWRFTGGW